MFEYLKKQNREKFKFLLQNPVLLILFFCGICTLWGIIAIPIILFAIPQSLIEVVETQVSKTFSQQLNVEPPRKIMAIEGDLSLIWTRDGIDVSQAGSGQRMVATADTVIIVGKTTSVGGDEVIALDGNHGQDIRWRTAGPNPLQLISDVYASDSVIYVGTGGSSILGAYDVQTGKSLWQTRLRGDRGVRNLYGTDDYIFVKTSESYNLLEPSTGEVLESVLSDLHRLPSIDTIKDAYFSNDVFSQGISIDWNRQLNDVWATDCETDQDLWTKPHVSGNVAATDDAVYLLRDSGKLQVLDPRTGLEVASVRFDSPTSGHVAIDADAGRLYVLLEDSHQLFAFEIVEEGE